MKKSMARLIVIAVVILIGTYYSFNFTDAEPAENSNRFIIVRTLL